MWQGPQTLVFHALIVFDGLAETRGRGAVYEIYHIFRDKYTYNRLQVVHDSKQVEILSNDAPAKPGLGTGEMIGDLGLVPEMGDVIRMQVRILER